MNTPDDLRDLFRRFLAGECTPGELQQLFLRFGTGEEGALRALIAGELKREEAAPLIPDPGRMRELYAGITAEINGKKKRQYRRALALAASLAAGLLLLGGYFLARPKAVRMASVREVRLPDGSLAWLDAGTVLRYPDHFSGAARRVTLEAGAAFFEVVHQVARPFVVQTGSAVITVLGTSFEVAAFKDRTTRVSVKTGRVGVQLVSQKGPARLLSPGQAAVVTPAASVLAEETLADIAAWRGRQLLFRDQPLGEVLETLERNYGVRFEVQDRALLTERVTMRLDNPPLQDILTAVSFANHFNYQIHDQLIVIK